MRQSDMSKASAGKITRNMLRRWPLPELSGENGKDDRGRLLVVGGSVQIPGGVVLAAIGAMRAGAGKLQIGTARDVAPWVAVTVPEARVIGLVQKVGGELGKGSWRAICKEIERCDTLVIGPGMSDGAATEPLLGHCLRAAPAATLVVDGAALDAFRGRRPLPKPHDGGLVITPHAGEMARLWGIERTEVLRTAPALARQAAKALRAVVVLKGPRTYVAAPDGRLLMSDAGNLGLGTSGSGDVLAGVIAGLCARGADPFQAAAWGVFAHAHAGELLAARIAPLGYLARELLDEIPAVLHGLG